MRSCWTITKRLFAGAFHRVKSCARLAKRAIVLLRRGDYDAFVQGVYKKLRSAPIVGRLCVCYKNYLDRRDIRNFERKPRPHVVNILTPLFFDFEGKDMYCGGAERYLIELNRIIRKLGYETAVYQCGTSSWVRWYNDLCVEGLPASGDIELLNREFHRRVPPGALTIYFAFSYAFPYAHPNSLGISHGIWWDHAVYQYPQRKGDSMRDRILKAMSNCKNLVSVDTNTINWVRATDVKQSGKMAYIPNFVDLDSFTPSDNRTDTKNIVILYPRRLYEPRGFWLVAELIPYFCRRYDNVEFHFVGKGDAAELEHVGRLVEQYPGRVRHYHLEPEDMHKAYQAADITLIPTVASEGTSLSCIEAMASGNAVIATDVGGLTDLIINGHNGLLVSPKAGEIKEAVKKLISDPELRQRLQHNAREISKCFSLDAWRERWEQYLGELLPRRETIQTGSGPCWSFLHLSTPGITWERAKQRPQHLLESFAELGHHAFFVSDSKSPHPSPGESPSKPDLLHLLHSDRDLYLTNPVLYIYHAYLYPKLKQWPKRRIIYDILDDPAIHAEGDVRMGRGPDNNYLYYHGKLLVEADIVITSSHKLHQQYRLKRPDILLVPNAVKAGDFANNFHQRPADLPFEGAKIIGYYGAIAEWFDFDLIRFAAEQRPQYQYVLMGLTNCPEKIQYLVARCANVHYLGEKPYEELPGYLAYFDAALVPFLVNDITHAVSPLKLFEYMAGGKPVVSTDILECRKYESVLIAKNAQEFPARLDQAIALGRDENFKMALWNCASANSWKTRAEQILEALQDLTGKNAEGLVSPAPAVPLAKVS
ncbi:MAG: glycosyltransferase [Thermoguttaceae bacterium]|jgi:glycosyltransferase involved in cell wall biosynthesis